jgi:ribosomal protein S18 acetylase RimI-like enzyme
MRNIAPFGTGPRATTPKNTLPGPVSPAYRRAVSLQIATFAGEFAALAAWTGQSEQDLRQDEDYRPGGREHWLAWDGGQVVGAVHPWRTPDGRLRLYFDDCRPDSYGPLADAIDGECYVQADSADADTLARLRMAGFADLRAEYEYEVPVSRLDAPVPDGLRIVTADQTELEPLMMLDCAIRADIPGADGWQPDPAWFREETYDSPFFDPQTYRVALDGSDYVGLARVWRPHQGRLPRLGCVGVRREYRQRGLARALIAAAFAVLHERGVRAITCEVDETNGPSNALFASLGATRIGGTIELRRPAVS